MRLFGRSTLAVTVAGWATLACVPAPPLGPEMKSKMSFFVTSRGMGDGGNLKGLAGADAHCQGLASAVGAGMRKWAAYLSTQGEGAVNARDRIGQGPWYNAKGELIARDVAALHRYEVNINERTALDENGAIVTFVKRDKDGKLISRRLQPEPVKHDILTGTQLDGTAFGNNQLVPGEDRTCRNWTSGGKGNAMYGHHDRAGFEEGLSPWNAAHPIAGCSQNEVSRFGGAGLFYCFAAD